MRRFGISTTSEKLPYRLHTIKQQVLELERNKIYDFCFSNARHDSLNFGMQCNRSCYKIYYTEYNSVYVVNDNCIYISVMTGNNAEGIHLRIHVYTWE